MSHDLRSYIAQFTEDELFTVERSVQPGAEISSVVKALEPYGAPAVKFTNVESSEWPVLMGTFGTRERLARAFGIDHRELLEHVIRLQRQTLPEPVRVADAPVQEVVMRGEEVDLSRLPFATHSKSDAGAYITAGVVLARDQITGNLNTGMYRMMITGTKSITINAAPDHDLGRIFARARETGEQVPIAVVIGHHPAYLTASQLKNNTEIDCHNLAGGLVGERLPVTDGISIDLPIPARAELVLEGVVDPEALTQEGPFGEFSYHYGEAKAPLCTITAVTHRKDPIFLDLHPTHAEHLCLWLYPGREARLLEAVRRSVPGVVDVRIPFHGGSFSAFISVRKRKEGDGKQAIFAAFAADHFLKSIIVVDEDIDVHDTDRVLWASHVRFQAGDDLIAVDRVKGIRMDPSAHQFFTDVGADTLTSKLGMDATRPLTGFPEQADLPHEGYENVDLREYLNDAQILRVSASENVRRRLLE